MLFSVCLGQWQSFKYIPMPADNFFRIGRETTLFQVKIFRKLEFRKSSQSINLPNDEVASHKSKNWGGEWEDDEITEGHHVDANECDQNAYGLHETAEDCQNPFLPVVPEGLSEANLLRPVLVHGLVGTQGLTS